MQLSNMLLEGKLHVLICDQFRSSKCGFSMFFQKDRRFIQYISTRDIGKIDAPIYRLMTPWAALAASEAVGASDFAIIFR